MDGTLVPQTCGRAIDFELEHSAVLAALYARGAPRSIDPRPGGWPEVLRVLRVDEADSSEAEACLGCAGLWEEAAVLASGELRSWAMGVVSRGAVLCACCLQYPRRWSRTLGAEAPPCVWVSGEVPAAFSAGPVLSVLAMDLPEVDGRTLRSIAEAAEGAGWACAAAGPVLERGRRAAPRDRAILEILACGLDDASARGGALRFAVSGPGERATEARRRERDRLVAAIGDALLVLPCASGSALYASSPHCSEPSLFRFGAPIFVLRRGKAQRLPAPPFGATTLSDLEELEAALRSTKAA